VLAAVGLYGVLAQGVAERTREIGIRMALGGNRREILRPLLRQALRLTGLGIGLGLAGAAVLMPLLGQLLYGVRPSDPITLLAVAVLLLAVAGLASFLPARRALGVDPLLALRCE